MGNDAVTVALVHNYFQKHGMSDIVRIFESEAASAGINPAGVPLLDAVKALRIRKLVKKNKEKGGHG
jgi:hypothetical protein